MKLTCVFRYRVPTGRDRAHRVVYHEHPLHARHMLGAMYLPSQKTTRYSFPHFKDEETDQKM